MLVKSLELQKQDWYTEIVPPAEVCEVSHASLFGSFPNYAGIVNNGNGTWPVSWMHLSKPTGHYVNRFGMALVNAMMKHHAVMLIGNTCAPGLFLFDPPAGLDRNQFQFVPRLDCSTVIANVPGVPTGIPNSVVFEAEPFMVLRIRSHWNQFEDYLADMQSKYRTRTKKVLDLSQQFTSSRFSGSEISDELIQACSQLLKETLRNKTIALNQDLASILKSYRNSEKDNFHIHAYTLHGKTAGFISWLKSGNSMHAMQVGYDEQVGKDAHLYQRMMYDLVELAIVQKMDSLNLGRTASEIKSTLGAEPASNSFVIYLPNPVWRFLVGGYQKWFYRPEKWIQRKPFKGES